MIRNHIIYNSASNWKFDISKTDGDYIWDGKGNKLIDFTSGWNVCNLGWNNVEIRDAMISQSKRNLYAPMETADESQVRYAKRLTDSLPDSLNCVGRTTGGMESNEEAIKTAYAYTGRKKIISFLHSYHGQSISMLTASLNRSEVSSLGPIFPGIIQMKYPVSTGDTSYDKQILADFEKDLEKLLSSEDVAAVLTEAGIITGWGSTYIAPKGFIKVIRKLTKKYGTLLILDEIGTGYSRCGKLFGMYIEDVVPDIATFAKGISNGAAAIGAMVTTTKIADKTWETTNLQSTFGWTPVACAAADKTLEIHMRDKVWEKSDKDGEYIRSVLRENLSDLEYVNQIRGWGMEIGLSFKTKTGKLDTQMASNVMGNCISKGLYVLYGDDANIQLMPNLLMERKTVDRALEILIDVVKNISK